MSAWKSPLLYIGILLILAGFAALVVPPFLDWTRYRADIEEYGRQLTGRDVVIAGNIDARLFPWPRLRLDDVRIANPPGARQPELLKTGEVTVGLALAPLIAGKVAVETIRIDKPVFVFERLATGHGTWALDPAGDLTRLVDPSQVSVSDLELRDGTIILADARRGGMARLEDLDATISAPKLDGPWRFRGLMSYAGQRMSIGVTTGKLKADSDVRFAVRIAPEDDGGMAYFFDGVAGQSDEITGSLRVSPSQASDGRADSQMNVRPMTLKADITASFDTVKFDNVEIAPQEAADAGNMITGKAVINLGTSIDLTASLKAAKLDVDGMTGARGREMIYSGEFAQTLSEIVSGLPEGFSASYRLEVTSLLLGGESLDGVDVQGSVSRDRLEIGRFEASFPGQTTGRISGTFVPDRELPQLIGNFAVDSVSLRDFIVWALPERREDIVSVWSGARGRLEAQGAFDLTGARLRLSAEKYRLDDTAGVGELSILRGEKPGVSIRLIADTLNIDRYAPSGLTVGAVEDGAMTGVVDLIAVAMAQGDLQVILQADQLDLHGVTARDIAIDAAANGDGVELRTVEIGEVGGARLDVAGLLGFPGEGVAGALRADIKAPEPRGLLQLFGLIPRQASQAPDWVNKLGGLDVVVTARAETADEATTASLLIKGAAGPSQVDARAQFSGAMKAWDAGEVSIEANLEGADAAAVAGLAGTRLFTTGPAPFSIALKAKGVPRDGLATTFTADAIGATLQFAGRAGMRNREVPFAQGRLALLAEQAQDLFEALGIATPPLGLTAQVLSAEGKLEVENSDIAYRGVSGTAAGTAFDGDVRLTRNDSGLPVIEVNGDTGRLNLAWLLGTRLFPRGSGEHDLQTGFSLSHGKSAGVSAQINVKRASVVHGFELQDATVHLNDDAQRLALDVSGKLTGGGDTAAKVTFTREAYDVAAQGEVSTSFRLDEFLRTASGEGAMKGEARLTASFTGAGRSPAGILSGLTGSGDYALDDASLVGADVPAFVDALQQLEDAKRFDRLVEEVLGRGQLPVGSGRGDTEIDNGVLKLAALPFSVNDTDGSLRIVADLPAGLIDISALLESKAIKDLPPFEVAYAGPLDGLSVSRDVAAVKSFVGVNVLLRGMSKLEELQREQERLFRQDSSYAREQVLQDLEKTARERRRAEEEARRKAEEERLQREIEARKQAEAEARRLAEELDRQRKLDEEKRKADEVMRALREEEQRRALEEALSRTRLEKHIRRTQPTIERQPLPELQPANPPVPSLRPEPLPPGEVSEGAGSQGTADPASGAGLTAPDASGQPQDIIPIPDPLPIPPATQGTPGSTQSATDRR